MSVKKYYLYKVIMNDKAHNSQTNNQNEGIIWSANYSLLGLDRTIWRTDKIRNAQKNLRIKPFEVQQSNFRNLISLSNELGISILSLTFSRKLDPDEAQELKNLLDKNNAVVLTEFAEEQLIEQLNEIEEITFAFYTANIGPSFVSFSRNAVLTLNTSDKDHSKYVSMPPVGILSGNYIPYENITH